MRKTSHTNHASVVTGASKPNDDGQLATATISCLSIELLSSVVRQSEIRYWKQQELVNRQFRAAVLAAWKDLRSLRLEHVFGFLSGHSSMFERKEFRERRILRKLLETLVVRAPLITEVGGLSLFSHHFSPDVVDEICRLDKLERLHLARNEAFPDYVPRLLSQTRSAQCLRYLNLSGCLSYDCRRLSETVRMALSRLTLQELVYRENSFDDGACLSEMNCELLTLLDVTGSAIDCKVLSQLLFRCTKLAYLDLSSAQLNFMALHENNVFEWLRSAKCLRTLKMNHYEDYFDRIYSLPCYAELQRSLFDLGSIRALTELQMTHSWFCTDAVMNAIVDGLANSLKTLHFGIAWCSETALLNLAERMVNLEQLVFCSNDDHCMSLSKKVVRVITTKLSNLVVLDLSRPSPSALVLENLIKLKNLHRLTVIGAFNDRALIAVASALGHQLIALTIPESAQISDEGVVAAAEFLRKLRHLNLEKSSISDRSLTVLARHCAELRSLNLGGCRNITGEGAQSIVDSCRKMEELCLCGTLVDILTLNKYDRISCFFKRISSDAVLDISSPDVLRCSINSCYDNNYQCEVLSRRDYYCL